MHGFIDHSESTSHCQYRSEDFTTTEILTHSRQAFDLDKPDPSLISLEDIARSLSNICRFNGHCCQFYSVAEHSVMVTLELINRGEDHKTCASGLLHDAHKAYVGDVIRPIQKVLDKKGSIAHKFLSRFVSHSVRTRFNLPIIQPKQVSYVDDYVLAWEMYHMMPIRISPTDTYRPLDFISSPNFWTPHQAYLGFMLLCQDYLSDYLID